MKNHLFKFNHNLSFVYYTYIKETKKKTWLLRFAFLVTIRGKVCKLREAVFILTGASKLHSRIGKTVRSFYLSRFWSVYNPPFFLYPIIPHGLSELQASLFALLQLLPASQHGRRALVQIRFLRSGHFFFTTVLPEVLRQKFRRDVS